MEEGSKDALKRATQENREIQRERDELRREREVLMKEKLAMAVEIETLTGEMERCRTAVRTIILFSHHIKCPYRSLFRTIKQSGW